MSLFGESYRYDDGVPDSMCCEHGEPLSVACDECDAPGRIDDVECDDAQQVAYDHYIDQKIDEWRETGIRPAIRLFR